MKKAILVRSVMSSIAISALLMICTLASAADAKPPIKLGVLSAWDYAGGQGCKRGATLAIRDINKSGGLLGRQVKGVFYDNKGSTDQAKQATERLIYMDKVDAITGLWRSDLAIVVQPLIMKAKKLLFIGGASSPILTLDRIGKNYPVYKYTFTTMSNTNYIFNCFESGIPGGFKLGLNKIAVLIEKAAWCDPLYTDVMKKYKDKVVFSSRFSPDTQDFSVLYTKAKAAGANNLYLVSTGSSGTPSVKQWHDMQIPMLFTGYNVAAQDGNFWKGTEGNCAGVVDEIIGGGAGFPMTPKSIPWYKNYIKTFGEKPVAYTNGLEYDAVMSWAKAVKMAGTTNSDAVRKALESKKFHYTGVCGVITGFDKVHNPIGQDGKPGEAWGWIVFQWQDGKMVPLAPPGIKGLELGKMIIPQRIKALMK